MKVILAVLFATIAGHVCSSSSLMDRRILDAVTENDGLEIIEEMGEYYKEKMMQRFERFRVSCDACKSASEFIADSVFGNERIREYVLRIIKLNSPCSRVPVGILRSACNDALEAVYDLLWDQSLKYWTNARICYQLRLCNSSEITSSQLQEIEDDSNARNRMMQLMSLNRFNNNKLIRNLLCTICKTATDIISDIVFENEQIKEFALNFVKDRSPCVNMSIFTQRACFETLTAAFDLVWDQTDKELTDGKLCSTIRVCNGTTTRDAKILRMVENKNPCQFCETMVLFMEPVVGQNLSLEETIEKSDKSCRDFKCKAFISTYGVKVAQMIRDNKSYQQICNAVGYCL